MIRRRYYERTSEADSLAVCCGSSQIAVETFTDALINPAY